MAPIQTDRHLDYDAFAAEHYKFRTPYGPRYIQMLVAKAKMDRGRVLDLCTGHGQLAHALAPFVDAVTAIDGSPAMLAHAKPAANVTYLCHDVNGPDIRNALDGQRFSHVTVGRGLHWIDDATLMHVLNNLVAPQGAMITAASGYSMRNPWLRQLRQASISADQTRAMTPRDWQGFKRLPAMGYAMADQVVHAVKLSLPWQLVAGESIFKGAVSDAFRKDPQACRRYQQNFFAQAEQILKPFMQDGKVQAQVSMSAFIYTAQTV
jgi:SAM-dependent methyltransferase